MATKKKPKHKGPVIQDHHITYEPPWVVRTWKGEHMILTYLGWRKRVSKGFITALKQWIETHEGSAVEL